MGVEPEPLVVVFVRFLAIAVLVTYGASRFRIPYTIAMVLVGLGVSILGVTVGVEGIELNPELILLVFLPGLLFEASYHVDFRLFRTNLWPVSILAVAGVILSTAIIGLVLYWVLGLPLADSLLFGIIISATDPVAVVALFKQLGVERRLGIVVEGESLFNDGIVIVGFGVLATIASGMPDFSVGGTLFDVALSIGGGIFLGLIVGVLFAELMKHTDDPLIDIALTTILAYGTYLLAEDALQGRVSPIIAVVVAGIVVGNYGLRTDFRFSARSTMLITSFWDFIVFLINSAVFLLIGIEVQIGVLVGDAAEIAVAIAAVLLARAIVVYGLRPILNLRPPAIPLTWSHVMFWSALRGAVSVALAVSIPYAVESRQLLIAMVFGVVLFSMIVQALTMRPLLNRLGLASRRTRQREFEDTMARLAAMEASVVAVERMDREHVLTRPLADQLRKQFEDSIDAYSRRVAQLVVDDPGVAEANVRLVRQELAHHQEEALLRLLRRGIITDEVYSDLVATIDEHLEHPGETEWVLASGLSGDLRSLVAAAHPEEEIQTGADLDEADQPVPPRRPEL